MYILFYDYIVVWNFTLSLVKFSILPLRFSTATDATFFFCYSASCVLLVDTNHVFEGRKR